MRPAETELAEHDETYAIHPYLYAYGLSYDTSDRFSAEKGRGTNYER
jgi:hypothetical protein